MEHITCQIKSFFDNKIQEHGANPAGLGWKDEDAQLIRFKQIIKIINHCNNFSVNHLGCGYGALHHYLLKHGCNDFIYRGYDISEEMIKVAEKENQKNHQCELNVIERPSEMIVSDYSVASGIFNVKMDFKNDEWLEYIIHTLEQMNEKSLYGFSFNMLTSYSDKHLIKDDLYYGDPCFFFDYCKKNFSNQVTLLHDYELYDFTILVKKHTKGY
jgi:hypothetical protein